jgi:hypothetical protein
LRSLVARRRSRGWGDGPNAVFFLCSGKKPLALQSRRTVEGMWELDAGVPVGFREEKEITIVTALRRGLDVVAVYVMNCESLGTHLSRAGVHQNCADIIKAGRAPPGAFRRIWAYHKRNLHPQWKTDAAVALDEIAPRFDKLKLGGPLVLSKLANVPLGEAIRYLAKQARE